MLHKKGWIANDTVRLPLSLGDISEEVEQNLVNADKEIAAWLKKQ
ncbi:hypothetical protein [Rhodohalobacter sp.]|nr:hypothetical protein [Rhodohalobacter sp.]MDZ7756133.1 hypothetical protein [Rhodohalobacter sp.]